ncbi:hypothetical protein [Novosphingobium lindaniclasticum]|uniref:Cellulose-binding domain protein n=1 Tax=Novosphingobium lindaniclasticum LE124 TaxID=1096930 RepID=T0HQK7_9SPHN|nr:hypothetical protein [Novosphingobium lindaniclasticum]EQB15317.1 hypothetical protein L284_11820 [Novosphingobium lindaniclasticum LE124]
MTGVCAAAAAAIGVVSSGIVNRFPRAEQAFPVLAAGAPHAVPRTTLGINLFGLQTFNRQQVFANMIAQSEWFSSRGEGWSPMPAARLDALGWVRSLEPGQTAPRPLVLPAAPFGPATVRCTFAGKGALQAGGAARLIDASAENVELELRPSGAEDEGAWVELIRTDPADPLRDLDCRKSTSLPGERFDPEFLSFLSGFEVIRFLDWQRTNDNAKVAWANRTLPTSASQVGIGGASIEDMVDLANATGADPWFLMPYEADADYIRGFARLVRKRLDPRRKVYVELGNEVWNQIFDASAQAEREGLALGLGHGDPTRARMERYAGKITAAMRIWTEVYADRPGSLIRVCASQHANPELARMILDHEDTRRWVDALATAPYLWLDLEGRSRSNLDPIFEAMPDSVERTFAMAAANREIAAAHGLRYIAYEGGQHLVTRDIDLARAVQRDARMARVYDRYLEGWRRRFGDTLTLYASTAPIGEYGAWGLREYAGQPADETPKLTAVRRFQREAR